MTLKTKAILFSAFLCPGFGQFQIGKKWRGFVFISGVAIALVLLFLSITRIILQEMPPEMLMRLSPIEFSSAFLTIRYRTYHENMPVLVGLIAIWLSSIIDLAIWKPSEEDEPGNT